MSQQSSTGFNSTGGAEEPTISDTSSLTSQLQVSAAPFQPRNLASNNAGLENVDYLNMQDQIGDDFEDGSNNFFPKSRFCTCCEGSFKSCSNCVAQQGFSECEFCQLPNPLLDPVVKRAVYQESTQCPCCAGYNLNCPNCQDCEGVCQECHVNPIFADYKISVSEWVVTEDGSFITGEEFDAINRSPS